jgi:hypothetical protein
MRNYIERAKDFIELLFPLIDDCEEIWDYRNAVAMFNRVYSRKVQCKNGIARVAFITSDYVVKCDYDEDNVEDVGGCENEIKIYHIAEQEGFAYMFAEITPYSTHGRTFYIMPRIEHIGRYEYTYADELMTITEKRFCKKHNITDLHSHNYGFRNGHICIFDYACNCRETSDDSFYSSSLPSSWS